MPGTMTSAYSTGRRSYVPEQERFDEQKAAQMAAMQNEIARFRQQMGFQQQQADKQQSQFDTELGARERIARMGEEGATKRTELGLYPAFTANEQRTREWEAGAPERDFKGFLTKAQMDALKASPDSLVDYMNPTLAAAKFGAGREDVRWQRQQESSQKSQQLALLAGLAEKLKGTPQGAAIMQRIFLMGGMGDLPPEIANAATTLTPEENLSKMEAAGALTQRALATPQIQTMVDNEVASLVGDILKQAQPGPGLGAGSITSFDPNALAQFTQRRNVLVQKLVQMGIPPAEAMSAVKAKIEASLPKRSGGPLTMIANLLMNEETPQNMYRTGLIQR